MSKIYIVSTLNMEPYSHDTWPVYGFETREKAEDFLKNNKGVFDEGWVRWDDTLQDEVPCEESHEDAEYNYGWMYSSYIGSVVIKEEN